MLTAWFIAFKHEFSYGVSNSDSVATQRDAAYSELALTPLDVSQYYTER